MQSSRFCRIFAAPLVLRRALGAVLIATTCTTTGCQAEPISPRVVQPRLAQAPGTQVAPAQVGEVQPLAIPAALDDYIARPEPSYKWEKMEQKPARDRGVQVPDLVTGLAQGANVTDLKVTSQEWQGNTWTHHVQVFRPTKVEFPDLALVLVTYGRGSVQETLLGQLVANVTGATFVQLFDIPNQPLYGMREDDLIAHTFTKYLETGDTTWPLLFPMTKSVVKTMDAVDEFSTQEWKQPIKRFIITGASKRGWTTWLTAAVDKRVVGIAPMVYNNLDLQKQMPHQLATWGEYSEQIQDYTRRGLQQQLGTPRGKMLAAMVDPWTYRSRITVPKLIVNGTNDRYWPLDALNLYWNDLRGDKWVLYAPNAGHSLGGQEQRVFGSVAEWCRRIAAGQANQVPQVNLGSIALRNDGSFTVPMLVNPAKDVKAARIWMARSATRDFRQVKWTELPTQGNNGSYSATVPANQDANLKYVAAFGEIEVEGKMLPMRLSSQMFVTEAK